MGGRIRYNPMRLGTCDVVIMIDNLPFQKYLYPNEIVGN